jgi:hypothetical protein
MTYNVRSIAFAVIEKIITGIVKSFVNHNGDKYR